MTLDPGCSTMELDEVDVVLSLIEMVPKTTVELRTEYWLLTAIFPVIVWAKFACVIVADDDMEGRLFNTLEDGVLKVG